MQNHVYGSELLPVFGRSFNITGDDFDFVFAIVVVVDACGASVVSGAVGVTPAAGDAGSAGGAATVNIPFAGVLVPALFVATTL